MKNPLLAGGFKYAAGGVVRVTDDAFIPDDASNADRQEFNEWLAAGGIPVPLVEVSLVDRLISYAAAKRWDKENGGITIAGIPIATDDRAKIMILGARVAATANAEWSTVWQGTDGSSYPINAAAIAAISDAVATHVAECFAIFDITKAAIIAGMIETEAAVDLAFA